MSRYIVILLLIFSTAGCKPLMPGDAPKNIDITVTSIKTGESITLYKSDTSIGYVIVELASIVDSGYYSLDLSPAIYGEDFIVQNVKAEFYRDKECKNIESMNKIDHGYINGINDQCWQDVFSFVNPRTIFVKIDLSRAFYYNMIDLNLAFVYKGSPITDPFPDYNTPREISPAQSLDGVISRFMMEAVDKFSLTGLNAGTIYKLSVDYLFDDVVFNPPYYKDTEIYIPYENRCAQYYAEDREVVFFSVTDSTLVTIFVRGSTGIRYDISLETESKDFASDAFEPDNGPISGTMETITDTGTSPMLSQTHTWVNGESDWIEFIPKPDESYGIRLVLEDTWYDTVMSGEFSTSLFFEIVRPEGSEIETSYKFYFPQAPETPVTSTNSLDWHNSRAQPDAWFFRITPAQYQLRGEYSVRIEKI